MSEFISLLIVINAFQIGFVLLFYTQCDACVAGEAHTPAVGCSIDKKLY